MFAIAGSVDGVRMHAIGDVVSETLYRFDGSCQPYVSTAGTSLRFVGPPLPPETFVGAVVFGER
jgi:hypothetical protein